MVQKNPNRYEWKMPLELLFLGEGEVIYALAREGDMGWCVAELIDVGIFIRHSLLLFPEMIELKVVYTPESFAILLGSL